MKLPEYKMKQVWIVFVYAVFYFVSFILLERRDVEVHIISCRLDQYIPFCEWFIIPYLLWFVYITVFLIWFTLGPSTAGEFHRYAFYIGTGMTLFILISWLWPNGLQLRPEVYPRDNILTTIVKILYTTDTSTNVFPSIHVFNSVATCIAIWDTHYFRKKYFVRWGTLFLTILIVLSTMFLKQHSVIDVMGGLIMAFVLWRVFYHSLQRKRHMQHLKIKMKEAKKAHQH
ncbi:MAG: phosphatase PAP2 family protein [Lachnospiraceae bacterium]|nr:phosphatase PAP2 family protein [Lachnospiraceae bacterium]